MKTEGDWVVVGRFGRPHGVKGFITVLSFTEPFTNLLDYADWHAEIQGVWQPLKITHIDVKSQRILVQIEGYIEREEVAALTNVNIAVRRAQLPALAAGEYYHHQLVGLNVSTQEGVQLGVVKEVLATGSNDVLVVVGERRRLIPYLPGEYVIEINLTEQKMLVDWDVDF